MARLESGTEPSPAELESRYIRANGIDIFCTETGAGEPLVVLNNAMVSTNPIWSKFPFAFAGSIGTLAEHLRVIVPNTRGSGRTVHPGGPIPYTLLADDVAALIESLHLDAPRVCGFSEGGTLATIVAIRTPDAVRAIVNLGGHDALDPDPGAASYVMTRQMLGGRPDATAADPDASARNVPDLRTMYELMEADHDVAQGSGHWRTVVANTFDRVSQPSGYTTEDFRAVTVPALILVGDRDPFCPVEDGAAAYRALPDGALGVLPDTGHEISPAAVTAMIDFFEGR